MNYFWLDPRPTLPVREPLPSVTRTGPLNHLQPGEWSAGPFGNLKSSM